MSWKGQMIIIIKLWTWKTTQRLTNYRKPNLKAIKYLKNINFVYFKIIVRKSSIR